MLLDSDLTNEICCFICKIESNTSNIFHQSSNNYVNNSFNGNLKDVIWTEPIILKNILEIIKGKFFGSKQKGNKKEKNKNVFQSSKLNEMIKVCKCENKYAHKKCIIQLIIFFLNNKCEVCNTEYNIYLTDYLNEEYKKILPIKYNIILLVVVVILIVISVIFYTKTIIKQAQFKYLNHLIATVLFVFWVIIIALLMKTNIEIINQKNQLEKFFLLYMGYTFSDLAEERTNIDLYKKNVGKKNSELFDYIIENNKSVEKYITQNYFNEDEDDTCTENKFKNAQNIRAYFNKNKEPNYYLGNKSTKNGILNVHTSKSNLIRKSYTKLTLLDNSNNINMNCINEIDLIDIVSPSDKYNSPNDRYNIINNFSPIKINFNKQSNELKNLSSKSPILSPIQEKNGIMEEFSPVNRDNFSYNYFRNDKNPQKRQKAIQTQKYSINKPSNTLNKDELKKIFKSAKRLKNIEYTSDFESDYNSKINKLSNNLNDNNLIQNSLKSYQ